MESLIESQDKLKKVKVKAGEINHKGMAGEISKGVPVINYKKKTQEESMKES